MNSGQINGSRFGLRGKEEISSDLKVYFNVEAGFDADTGALGDEDRFFNRNSIVGLETRWGDFKIGRTAGLVSGNSGGIFGRVSPFGITWQEAPVDSGALGRRGFPRRQQHHLCVAPHGGLPGASAGFERDRFGRLRPLVLQDRYAAAGVTYRAGGLRFVAAVDRMFTKNAQAPGTAGYRGDDWMTYNIGGSYDFGMVRIHAGYQYGDGVTRVGKISSSVKGRGARPTKKEHDGLRHPWVRARRQHRCGWG